MSLRGASRRADLAAALESCTGVVIGLAERAEVREAWERFGPSAPITAFLPADFPAADQALLAGTALLETAPGSPLRRAIAELADVPVTESMARLNSSPPTGAPTSPTRRSTATVRPILAIFSGC